MDNDEMLLVIKDMFEKTVIDIKIDVKTKAGFKDLLRF